MDKVQVTVYFIHERTGHTDKVATFSSEELYMDCLPALEATAKIANMIVGESIEYDDDHLNATEGEGK